MNINLESMTTEEKLMAMELLWDDLCKNAKNALSPNWHEGVLADREKAICEGREEFLDWDEAKKTILHSTK